METSENPQITPMMAQYLEVKKANPDCLLFYRMGDFYEMFFDDAVNASKALDIALTKRGQYNDKDVPMCGVPAHSHEIYLSRLIKKGFKVAICEQLESPAEAKKRGYKSVVQRDVVRVITPGTLTEENLLDSTTNNYLCALSEIGKDMAVAWIDLSTGEFAIQEILPNQIEAILTKLDPSEILVSEKIMASPEYFAKLRSWKKSLTILPNARFDSINAEKRLLQKYQIQTLDAFGSFSKAEISVAGILIDYIELTQKNNNIFLTIPKKVNSNNVMEIDAATRRNLELTKTLNGEKSGSLLSVIDYTKSAFGGRLFVSYLSNPLTDVAKINERLDGVSYFLNNEKVLLNF